MMKSLQFPCLIYSSILLRSLFSVVSLGLVAAAQHSTALAADLSSTYSWQPVRIGAGGWMRGMQVHPTVSTVRVARSDTYGAFRYDSASNEWRQMVTRGGFPSNVTSAPFQHEGVGSVALARGNANAVFIAMAVPRSADVGGSLLLNVYRSTDGGVTFLPGNLSLDEQTGMSDNIDDTLSGERLSVDPNNAQVVYYASRRNGLWRSLDGGANFSRLTSSGAPASNSNVLHIRFDRLGGTRTVSGATVSSIAFIAMADGRILRTTDGGSSFSTTRTLPGGTQAYGACVDDAGNYWIVQTDTSNDGANQATGALKCSRSNSWSFYNLPYGSPQLVSVDPTNQSRVIVIHQGGGISRSTTGGASWVGLGNRFLTSSTQEIQWLRPGALLPPYHYISFGGGGHAPDGSFWVSCGNEGILQATINDSQSASSPPVWETRARGIEQMVAQAAIIPPGQKAVLGVQDEAAFLINDPSQFTATPFDIYRQDNNNGLSSTGGGGLAYVPNAPSDLYIATSNVFTGNPTNPSGNFSAYSTNGGVNWTKFASLTNNVHPWLLYGGSIAASARPNGRTRSADRLVWLPTNIYSQNSPAPFYSTNGGASWSQSQSFNSLGFAYEGYRYLSNQDGNWVGSLKQKLLIADQVTADRFYLHLPQSGFWRSSDGGATWSRTGAQLPAPLHHGQMEATRGRANHLWLVSGLEGANNAPAGVPIRGLFRSTNGGDSFTSVGSFEHATALALGAPAPGGSYPAIYVAGKVNGQADWGIFRSTDEGINWDRISGSPLGIMDMIVTMAASHDTFGELYIGFGGSSFARGTITGAPAPGALISGRVYELEPAHAPGTRLDASGTHQSANVLIWASHGGNNQRWRLTQESDGSWEVEPQSSPARRLDVAFASSDNGTNVQIYDDNNSNAQRWNFLPQYSDVYEIEPRNAPGKRLDVFGYSSANGTNVLIWQDSDGSNQRWRLILVP